MIKLKNIIKERFSLNESIFDKGVFKAIFFAGIPGAGKSYTLDKISDGNIQPRIVNFDKYAEFLSKKYQGNEFDPAFFMDTDTSKRMTINQLFGYIDGMLPLFIDTTSNKANRTLMRNGILKSFGYDTGMVWINTDLDVALKRIRQRHRSVPEDFVKDVAASMEENIHFYKKEFSNFFIEINNNEGELTDQSLIDAYKKVSSFFSSEIENPIGKRNFESVYNTSGYLSSIINKKTILNNLRSWY